MQQSLDLSCGDGGLGVSPGPASSSCSSTSHYFGPVPATEVPETLPFECNEDHDAELILMLNREARDAPTHSWLQTQPVLTAQHRHILVSWMQRACDQLHFALPTLALAVNLLDSFLCRTPVQQQDVWAVQLAAVACLSIAAKYEEVYIPSSIAAFQVDAPWDEPWQASQVMAMELAVLQALEWRVGGSSSAAFLDRLLHVAGVGRNAAGCLEDPSTAHAARDTAKSLIMSALLDERCLLMPPSCVAASALLLSMSAWCCPATTSAASASFSGRLQPVALQECLQHMRQHYWQPFGQGVAKMHFPPPLCNASQRCEAAVAPALVYHTSAAASQQQPRRSARLLGHLAAEPTGSSLAAVNAIAIIRSSLQCPDLVAGDDLVSASSLTSSQSTFSKRL